MNKPASRDRRPQKTLSIDALRLEQSPGRVIYSFGIDGKQVPRFASVSRARRGEEDVSLLGYQRPEVQKHITQIREYIESEGAMVPNAVVLAFGPEVRFIPVARKGGVATEHGAEPGTLIIPLYRQDEEKVGFVVDGQQRLAAIRESRRQSFPVFAVAFVAASDEEQREQFMLVNSTKPLPKGLIHELLPGMKGHLPPHLEKRKLPAELVSHLNHDPESPLQGAIRTATNPSGRIADNSMLQILETSLSDGVLWEIAQVKEEGEEAVEAMTAVLGAFWGAVREVWKDIWERKPRQSRLLHGAGVVTLGYLMEDMIKRHQGDGWPDQQFFERELTLIKPDCHWTEGVWDFGGDQRRRWDEIQNVNRDVMMLMNHMTRVYRLRSKSRARDRRPSLVDQRLLQTKDLEIATN